MDRVTIVGGWWQHVFWIKTSSFEIEIVCPLGWFKGHVIMKYVAIVIPLVEFDICSLELMSVDHIISEIYNSRIWEAILIGDNTTLLDYRHHFIGSLHAVDSRSRTWELGVSCCNLHRVLECNWLSIVGCWVNSKIWLWGANTPMSPSGLRFELIFLDDMIYGGWMGF